MRVFCDKKEAACIFFIALIFCILLPFFFLHQGLLLIDTGREFYIPFQMLKGEVLYKDIYNQYGALSYQFNAFLFLLFGQKINVLYISGIIHSFIIVIICYLLSREFLNRNLSFLLALLIMSELVFRTFLYNSVLTYSFAIVYALAYFSVSLLFLIKYLKHGGKTSAYFACLFAGISIANKYEFILYIFILFIALCFIKPLKKQDLFAAAAAFFVVPALSVISLILQGFNLEDLRKTCLLFHNLVNAPLLKLFFSRFGVFFNIKDFLFLIYHNNLYGIFAILPVLNIIAFTVKIKEIYADKPLFIFLLCLTAASAKNLFFLNVNHMGVFIFPLCIIAFAVLMRKYQFRLLPFILCICIVIFMSDDFASLKYKNYLLETPKGNIYTYKKEGELIKQACNFILNNTGINDKITVLPEGSIINFITNRKGDSFYYNLIPLLYIDVFKEENVISRFKENSPEYFIILPLDKGDYGSRFFGIDYAQNFYEMIVDNYNLVEEKNNIQIFKRKNI